MGWSNVMQHNTQAITLFEEIGRSKVLELRKTVDEQFYHISADGSKLPHLSPMAQQLVIRGHEMGPSNTIEMYMTARILSEGAKVFTPGNLDFAALEEMTLNIDFEDYAQPFDIIIIDLPDDYMANHETTCDPKSFKTFPSVDRHQPECVIIDHEVDKGILIANVVFNSGQNFKLVLNGNARPDNQIEDELTRAEGLKEYDDSLPVMDDERMMCYRVIRAGINACLLFDEAGVKKIGRKNEKHAQRLRDYIIKGQKRGTDIKKMQLELKTMPVYYTLNQQVELYKHVRTEDGEQGTEGSQKGPHRRRGHYRQQRYGPGNTLKKRIRIPSVLVNWHLFVGNDGQATSNYHYKG